MRDSNLQSRLRRGFLLFLPAAVTTSLLQAQSKPPEVPPLSLPGGSDDGNDVRLPNGKRQIDEILKDDYRRNLKDARDLTNLAESLEQDLEKDEAFVFDLVSLRKLDDMEKLTKRIRARMKRL